MRLWTLDPKYLDRAGLLAVWREGLLAQAVLRGQTRGYKNHPQLIRFRAHHTPIPAIGAYLHFIHLEAGKRGYSFDYDKIWDPTTGLLSVWIECTDSQLNYERGHLLKKLSFRDRAKYEEVLRQDPEPHPIFRIIRGSVEPWERVSGP